MYYNFIVEDGTYMGFAWLLSKCIDARITSQLDRTAKYYTVLYELIRWICMLEDLAQGESTTNGTELSSFICSVWLPIYICISVLSKVPRNPKGAPKISGCQHILSGLHPTEWAPSTPYERKIQAQVTFDNLARRIQQWCGPFRNISKRFCFSKHRPSGPMLSIL